MRQTPTRRRGSCGNNARHGGTGTPVIRIPALSDAAIAMPPFRCRLSDAGRRGPARARSAKAGSTFRADGRIAPDDGPRPEPKTEAKNRGQDQDRRHNQRPIQPPGPGNRFRRRPGQTPLSSRRLPDEGCRCGSPMDHGGPVHVSALRTALRKRAHDGSYYFARMRQQACRNGDRMSVPKTDTGGSAARPSVPYRSA